MEAPTDTHELSAAAEDLLLHTTGQRLDSPEPGRNRLVKAPCPELTELVEAGLVVGLGVWRIAGEHAWKATDAGLVEAGRIALARSPKRTRSQRRYDEWLRVADAYNISFGDWLRHRCYETGREVCE